MAAPVRLIDPMTAVTDAVTRLLEPYFPKAKWGGAAPKVIGLPLTSTMFERIAETTPRLYIGWSGFKADASARICGGTFTFSVFVVVKNDSGERVHLGDRFAAGLYASIVGVIAALHGRTIPDIGSIAVTDAGQQAAERWSSFGAAAGYVTFTISTSLGDFFGEGAAAEDFRELVSSFEVNTPPDAAPSVAVDATILVSGAPAP